MKEVILPNELAQDLIKILITDERSKLLLKAFIIGKEMKGNITLTGEFKISEDEVKSEINT